MAQYNPNFYKRRNMPYRSNMMPGTLPHYSYPYGTWRQHVEDSVKYLPGSMELRARILARFPSPTKNPTAAPKEKKKKKSSFNKKNTPRRHKSRDRVAHWIPSYFYSPSTTFVNLFTIGMRPWSTGVNVWTKKVNSWIKDSKTWSRNANSRMNDKNSCQDDECMCTMDEYLRVRGKNQWLNGEYQWLNNEY